MSRFPEKIRAQASGILLQCIEGLESFCSLIDDVYDRNHFALDPVSLQNTHRFEYVGTVLWLLYGIYAAKYRELLRNVISSTANEEFLVFAHCGRGLIETTATLRYYNKKTLAVVMAAKDPEKFSSEEITKIIDLLDKHSRGGRFNWESFWMSNRKDMAERLVATRVATLKKKKSQIPSDTPNPSQVSAQTAIDTWMSEEPGIVLVYDFFCELVHPNLGSNFLVMGARDGSLHVAGPTVKSLGRSLAIEGIKFLGPIIKEASSNMATLLYWAETTKPRET
jgi:hypothetical protein